MHMGKAGDQMINLDEYQLLVGKDELFQKNKILERAFELLSESILVNLTEPGQRERVAEELREYWLRKAEEEINK
jgi:hypothetical protein